VIGSSHTTRVRPSPGLAQSAAWSGPRPAAHSVRWCPQDRECGYRRR